MGTQEPLSTAVRSPALQVSGLQCRRGERLLFAPLSFDLDRGRVAWLRGANGQGKTTLLRTLAGLGAPAAGTIRWQASSMSAADRPPLVYLAHANGLKDDLSAFESLDFLLRFAGRPASGDVLDAALERLGVGAERDRLVRTLSQGQRRRVALARLAVADGDDGPRPWLLDEPFDALDDDGIERVAELLAGHARRGGSAVVTSHIELPLAAPAATPVFLHAPDDGA